MSNQDGVNVCDATVTVTSGEYRQVIKRVDWGHFDASNGLGFCAYGTGEVTQPGSYTVTVGAPGFKESSTPMTLTGDGCGDLSGGEFTVTLQPQ